MEKAKAKNASADRSGFARGEGPKYDLQDPHLFPSLNREKVFLVLLHPIKMLRAYKIAWEAKNLCADFFDMSSTDGPGDACRHFIWAAFLYKRFGAELSWRILSAHEMDSNQTHEAKEMDTANNLLGLEEAGRLEEEGRLSQAAIWDSFYINLRDENILFKKALSASY